jgi:hypothetical protein
MAVEPVKPLSFSFISFSEMSLFNGLRRELATPCTLLFSAPGWDGGWDGFDAAGQLGDLLRDGDKNI